MSNDNDDLRRNDGATPVSGYLRADDYLSADSSGRRFEARTILIPVLFILLHLVVVNLTAAAFILAYILSSSTAGSLADPSVLMNPDYLNEIIARYTPQISFAYALILIPVYILYLRQTVRKNPDAVWFRRVSATDILPSLAVMTGAMGVVNLFFLLLDWLSSRSPLIERLMYDYQQLAKSLTAEDTSLVWLAIGIGIAAPVAEELLFRGIIQGELRRVLPEWAAIVIQAVLFSAFHMQIIQSTYVLLPALLLGIAYAWSKSLWIPIAMHILFNLLGSLVPGLVQSSESLSGTVVLIEIIFIPIAVAAGVYYYRKTHKLSRLPKQPD